MEAFLAEGAPREIGKMVHALNQFSEEERTRVAQRIGEVETGTDAEIVCAVATESGRYDRAESLCGILFSLIFLISAHKVMASGSWEETVSVPLSLQALLVALGFLLGNWLASYVHGIRRLFVSRQEMIAEVDRSAHALFSVQGIGETRHAGGILIYLSLFEHRVEVLGGKTVMEKLEHADLEAIRDAILVEARRGQFAEGILAGIDRASSRLCDVLPASGQSGEELNNELLLFHPRP